MNEKVFEWRGKKYILTGENISCLECPFRMGNNMGGACWMSTMVEDCLTKENRGKIWKEVTDAHV